MNWARVFIGEEGCRSSESQIARGGGGGLRATLGFFEGKIVSGTRVFFGEEGCKAMNLSLLEEEEEEEPLEDLRGSERGFEWAYGFFFEKRVFIKSGRVWVFWGEIVKNRNLIGSGFSPKLNNQTRPISAKTAFIAEDRVD